MGRDEDFAALVNEFAVAVVQAHGVRPSQFSREFSRTFGKPRRWLQAHAGVAALLCEIVFRESADRFWTLKGVCICEREADGVSMAVGGECAGKDYRAHRP